MAVRKILDSDKIGDWQDKINETADQIPTGFTDNGDGTGTLQNGSTGIAIEITGTPAASIIQDSTHRFVTDAQKAAWSGNGSVEVIDDHAALLALTGMVPGDKCYVKDDDGLGNRKSYWYDGATWLVDSDPNWANINLNWNNIANRPTHTPAQIDAAINLVPGKVDQVTGKQLSTEDYTTAEKAKLILLQNFDASSINTALGNKVDKIAGKGLSEQDYTLAEKQKLLTLQNFDASTINANLANKVDKVANKGLSANDYTDAEKSKLAALNNLFVGAYTTYAALVAAHPTATVGSEANVDAGAGSSAVRYIWDAQEGWVSGGSGNVLSVNGQSGAVILTTEEVGEGATKKYFTEARTRSTILTGIAAYFNDVAVLATDTVLAGIGKLQGQISAIKTTLGTFKDLATKDQADWDTDISNKPNIPAAQIQSDWNQSTTGALDYIKNKPSIASTVPSPVNNNLVAMNADGTLKDSGKKASDFQTSIDNLQAQLNSNQSTFSAIYAYNNFI